MALISGIVWCSHSQAYEAPHKLTIEDVLNQSHIDQVALSPNGEWVAAVIPRPARAGEVFGRTAYEIDPSRNDIWLVPSQGGSARNITNGHVRAAGYWCAAWSPDGNRLAMLSTQPEGAEPRGGDNVRLYIWERATGGLKRAADAAMMTQTRYGSPLYRLDVRGGADAGTGAHVCNAGNENAPFAWLDNHRILAVSLPKGGVSGLIDQYSRPVVHTDATWRALHDGNLQTMTAVESGAARQPRDDAANTAILRLIDITTGASTAIATVPAYPFSGELTIAIAPDGSRAAILATLGVIPPILGQSIPYAGDTWSVEKRLGFVDLAAGATVRWVQMPAAGRFPLELFGWSPGSRRVALRGRANADDKATPLFMASADDLSVTVAGAWSVGGPAAGSDYQLEGAVLWVDDRQLLARVTEPGAVKPRRDWWLVSSSGSAASNLTADAANPPQAFRHMADGSFVTLQGGRLMQLDAVAHRLVTIAGRVLRETASVVLLPDAGGAPPAFVIKTTGPDGSQRFENITPGYPSTISNSFKLPAGAQLLAVDTVKGVAISSVATQAGLSLRSSSLVNASHRDLLSLDHHLAAVDWGKTRLIDYHGGDGQALKAAVILPPGYVAGRRYPVVTWVYAGYLVDGLDDFWLDPYLPGIYNLQLYAARGYVVLIPSIPLHFDAEKRDILAEVTKGTLPAIDRLIALGIADAERLGVMGQSFGGYSVYALVTQTNRFKAAVAISGFTDLGTFDGQFDATARGYPGIEHEMSRNWSITENGGVHKSVPPYADHDFYWRNSPQAFVDRVETPLLLIHGEYDIRGAMSQAETFFYSLYRQGKTARLLRYWGESHSLAQSPANVRSVYGEAIKWFDRYLIDNQVTKNR